MITRTVKTTVATTVVFNGKDIESKYFIVPDGLNVESATKWLRKHRESDDIRIVAVNEVTVEEELRGIKEEDFMKYSVPLNKETRKPIA